jgi:hypothetical protein
MSAILFQIEAIRKLSRSEWATTDALLATAAALKEIAAEVDRTLANRLEAEAAQVWAEEEAAWQRGDWL